MSCFRKLLGVNSSIQNYIHVHLIAWLCKTIIKKLLFIDFFRNFWVILWTLSVFKVLQSIIIINPIEKTIILHTLINKPKLNRILVWVTSFPEDHCLLEILCNLHPCIPSSCQNNKFWYLIRLIITPLTELHPLWYTTFQQFLFLWLT